MRRRLEALQADLDAWLHHYNRSSQRRSRYVIDKKRVSSAGHIDPARGVFGLRGPAERGSERRDHRHGGTATDYRRADAWHRLSLRTAASRRVFGETPTTDAALLRLSDGSGPSSAQR
jgi:hypothetical protein